MRKFQSIPSFVGWHVRIQISQEEYPWDCEIVRLVKGDGDIELFEARFENGGLIYFGLEDYSWIMLLRRAESKNENSQVLKFKKRTTKLLRVVK